MDKLTASKYFIKVADSGSFSKAADLLDLPISTISRRIKDLEQNLGVQLLKRSTRYLSLTDLGRIYYDQIEQAVRDFEMADQLVQEAYSKPSGKIKISALPSYANKHVYPILKKFRNAYPEIIIELMCTDTVHDLIKDNIDFAIRPTSAPPENLIARIIDGHKMAIVASPAYLKKSPKITSFEDIKHHKAICFSTPSGPITWFSYANDTWHEIEKKPYVICSDTCKVLDIVINGEGIALLPEWTYLESLKKGLVEHINIGWDVSFRSNKNQKLFLIYDKKTSKLKRNQTFLKFFLEQIK